MKPTNICENAQRKSTLLPARELVLTGSQIADMLKRAVEEKDSKLGDMRLPSALIFVLQRTFPCP